MCALIQRETAHFLDRYVVEPERFAAEAEEAAAQMAASRQPAAVTVS